MKAILNGTIAVAAASVLAGSIGVAQSLNEITVQGTRGMDVKTAHSPGGVDLQDITMSYAVSLSGLDLALHADVMTLDKRVHDAALAACKEIGQHYPSSKPNDADCAKIAADKAMVKVNELVAAAGKKAAK
jgi:UrcA family protein